MAKFDLAGLRLWYHIGRKINTVPEGRFAIVPWDQNEAPALGVRAAYCNLLDEENKGEYGPYMRATDTASKYGEGVINPQFPGFMRNVRDQVERRIRSRFDIIELDNPDAYNLGAVLEAHDYAWSRGLHTVAKNPLLTKLPDSYIKHPSVCAIVCERDDAQYPAALNSLRRMAGRPELPVYFVYHSKDRLGSETAGRIAETAQSFDAMHVTYSPDGEYTSVRELT